MTNHVAGMKFLTLCQAILVVLGICVESSNYLDAQSEVPRVL